MDSITKDGWVIKGLVVAKYPRGDLVGMFFGYYSLLVYQLQAVYITLFLVNRDLLSFYCFTTHLMSEILNYLMKHLLKHPRPEGGPPGGGLFEGRYGMPSQHCHCFAYLYMMVHLVVFHYYRQHIGSTKKILLSCTSTILLALQVYGRLYLKFHTLEQCLVGVAFGLLSALTFYTIGIQYFMPRAQSLCSLRLLRWFSFRKDLISKPPSLTTIRTTTSKQTTKSKAK